MRSAYRPVVATVDRAVLSAFPLVNELIWLVWVDTVEDNPDTCDAEVAASEAACVAAPCAV